MPGSLPRPLLIMPAWNEQEALPRVLELFQQEMGDFDIVVVNDGSTDSTPTVARRAGVTLIDLPINLGVGGAMRAGYAYARDNGYHVAIQVDSDGQHSPSDVRAVYEALQFTGADLVIGSRFAGNGDYRVYGPRKWAMKALAPIVSRVAHTKLTDVTSGLRACGRRAIVFFAQVYPAEYLGDTIESTILGARAGLVIRQTPAAMGNRIAGRPSHNPFKSTVFLLRAALALAIALISARHKLPDDPTPQRAQKEPQR